MWTLNHRLRWCPIWVALLAGCSPEVNLGSVPGAANGCAPPTPDLLVPEAPMLPGRHCMACHKDGGQAGLRVWTAAGTVYGSPTAPCNTGGLPGIRIDIADALQNNLILITLYSNRTGNFFTAEARDFRHIIARVTDESTGRFKQMTNIAPTGDCGSCHFAGGAAGGPIFLN